MPMFPVKVPSRSDHRHGLHVVQQVHLGHGLEPEHELEVVDLLDEAALRADVVHESPVPIGSPVQAHVLEQVHHGHIHVKRLNLTSQPNPS